MNLLEAQNALDECGLAGPVLTEQPDDRAMGHVKVDAVKHVLLLEALVNVVGLDDWIIHR